MRRILSLQTSIKLRSNPYKKNRAQFCSMSTPDFQAQCSEIRMLVGIVLSSINKMLNQLDPKSLMVHILFQSFSFTPD
ncbi:hypothetical protein HanIR_Chr17g0848691 [Helianthus annuus]|nr:hypothetical protein HanIR_Chr17g0848691 [Helianthus annuus]